tara:strand:- start:312 stop:620 length:309 start_codon:yes stop_codon:yes gene_type:complete
MGKLFITLRIKNRSALLQLKIEIMKKLSYVFYLVLCLVFIGCKNDSNVKNTIEWIEKADKPIMVIYYNTNGMTMEKRYTLIDAKSKVYNTGCVELNLPDTLK